MKITAVTALYPIGREKIDGRDTQTYIDWLNNTLQTPLSFIVFLDPSIDPDKIKLKSEDQIVFLAKEDLSIFSYRDRIEEIIATSSTVNRKDIAYKLSDYGMMVMSKIDLMKRAAGMSSADYLLWLDAGLCRFLPDLKDARVVRTNSDLGDASILLNTTYYLSQRLRLGKIPRRSVNNALALIMAGDLLIARHFVDDLEARVRFMVETEWLPSGLWSNEQVALGCLFFRGGLPVARILRTEISPLGATTRWLFGQPYFKRRFQLHVCKGFVREEIRLRLAPADECYVPGDFPEGRYRKWRGLSTV